MNWVIKFVIIFVVTFTHYLFSSDSTATISINGLKLEIVIQSELNVDLIQFQKFIDGVSYNYCYSDTLVDKLSSNQSIDTLINSIYMIDSNCVIVSKIFSIGHIRYSDSLLVLADYGNYDNIWGHDSLYFLLYPYSLMYGCYLIRVTPFNLEEKLFNELGDFYLESRRHEFANSGLNEFEIEENIDNEKKLIRNYKGRFIQSLSLSNPDIYFYNSLSRQFVLFYSP